mgnify:CR=1 FL=1
MGKLKNMDNYLEQVLKEGEKSLYHDRYAKVYRILYLIFNILLQPILIVAFFFSLNKDDSFSAAIFLIVAVVLIWQYLTFIFTEYCITDKRILKKTGFIARNVKEMNLSSVETVSVKQGVIDRILKTGSIISTGRGVENISFNYIDNPQEVREKIETSL